MFSRVIFVLSIWYHLIAACNADNIVPAFSFAGLTINNVPYAERQRFMRLTNTALVSLRGPCPFGAFGSVIVNHTASPAEVVCIGANANSEEGDPTLHGEIAAIQNCTRILRARGLSAAQTTAAFADLSLYTNAESCPMCASAIRWAGFKEYIYGTTIQKLTDRGWGQITISSWDVFQNSFLLGTSTSTISEVLTNETDPFFLWQFDQSFPCPSGCQRSSGGTSCTPISA